MEYLKVLLIFCNLNFILSGFQALLVVSQLFGVGVNVAFIHYIGVLGTCAVPIYKASEYN